MKLEAIESHGLVTDGLLRAKRKRKMREMTCSVESKEPGE